MSIESENYDHMQPVIRERERENEREDEMCQSVLSPRPFFQDQDHVVKTKTKTQDFGTKNKTKIKTFCSRPRPRLFTQDHDQGLSVERKYIDVKQIIVLFKLVLA
jgi:hypothetical protein